MKGLKWMMLWCVLCGVMAAQAQRVVVRGKVIDAIQQTPLHEAHIYVPQYGKGQVCDKAGSFSLMLHKGKQVELVISYVGYATQNITIYLQKDTTLTIAMQQNNRLPHVDIYGHQKKFGVEDAQMSAVEMPIEQVQRMPALFGETDVMKTLQKLPGVQASNDGQAGIYVRGGNYDQNQITLDRSPLYNAEHLKGFVSAINPDMVEKLTFYKGAFPAHYGGQLSSVVDVDMKDGDMNRYGGELSVGMMSSRLHVEGPLVKGKTSFNMGARLSYFDLIVQPLLEKVADNESAMTPYANINYFDVTAKITHLFSKRSKLSALFYMGNDVDKTAPTQSSLDKDYGNSVIIGVLKSGTDNKWGNIIGGLNWQYQANPNIKVEAHAGYSRYSYELKQHSFQDYSLYTNDALYDHRIMDSHVQSNSGIDEWSGAADVHWTLSTRHRLQGGAKVSYLTFNPKTRSTESFYNKSIVKLTPLEYVETAWEKDSLINKGKQKLAIAAIYAEDDWNIARQWRANLGLRYALFNVPGKTYHSIEPRASLRWMFAKNMALKLSYAHMAQGTHLLSSSNLVMPSDIWVPITKEVPLMKSDQWVLGYNYEPMPGLNLSVEGFYKQMDNLLEYREGYSLSKPTDDWTQSVATGKGEAYGLELLLQKHTGKTTGWIGYTWSKSLRKFDREGQEIFSGKRYYATNDRRHNLNIVANHRFNKHWDVALTWTYQSGRRGTLVNTSFRGSMPIEYGSGDYVGFADGRIPVDYPRVYMKGDHLFFFPMLRTYKERNGYQLPAIHRLDAAVTYTLQHGKFESKFCLSVYNVYNRRNISNVYIGYKDDTTVLKGICLLPVMPSISYTLKL